MTPTGWRIDHWNDTLRRFEPGRVWPDADREKAWAEFRMLRQQNQSVYYHLQALYE